MEGTNSIKFNQQTMNEILELYLNDTLFNGERVKVKKVESRVDSFSTDFTVFFEPVEAKP